ncbi:MAG: 50S ribosomal protein L11 methyltransferase [Anaerolineae bacterium]|nr:50S ribosomal protein L11 methyltransferase [Anaerolineae bacterium]
MLAVDIDPLAVRTTQENAVHNGVADRVAAQQGSLDAALAGGQRFDLALVNILAKVIIALCDQGLGAAVRPGGVLIAAGIIEEQADAVRAALEAAGLTVVETRTAADWVALVCRRAAE